MFSFFGIFILFSVTDECKRKLDPGSVSDHAGQIYCKGCHSKVNEPKGMATVWGVVYYRVTDFTLNGGSGWVSSGLKYSYYDY